MHTALRAAATAAFALSFAVPVTQAIAGPADYVYSAVVEEGEREIDFKAGSARLRDGTRESAWSLGLGWGVTSRWFTELYAKWHTEPGEPQRFDAWEWENRFQFTETGRWPVDLGAVVEIERPQDRSEGYEVRWGPLLQADFGPEWRGNLNLLFEKHYRAQQAGEAEFGYQWQLRYRWRPALEFGVQGFGGVGPWRQWAPAGEQSHVAGPVLQGRAKVGVHETVRWNAALLLGLGDGAPPRTLRAQVEFEF